MLKLRLQEEMKAAMKGGDKQRLSIVRLILAAIKQREVDDRAELTDEQVLAVLDKMVKQRRDSVSQFEAAGRTELAAQESYEIGVIQEFLPTALTEEEISALVDEAIASTGAAAIRDMGKAMGVIKPKVQGRADMGMVSALVKSKLSG